MRKFLFIVVLAFILSPSISFSAPSKKLPAFKIDPGLQLDDEEPLPSAQKPPPKFLKDKSIVCPALKKQFVFLVRGVNFTPKNEAWRISRFYAAARVATEAIRAGCW